MGGWFSARLFFGHNLHDLCFNICSYYAGRCWTRVIFGVILQRKRNYKRSLLWSQVLGIVAFVITIFQELNTDVSVKQDYLYFVYASRFLFGIASGTNLISKYIVTFTPRLLLKEYIMKFTSLNLWSHFIGFICGFLANIFNSSLPPIPTTSGIVVNGDKLVDTFCAFLLFCMFLLSILAFYDPNSPDFSITYFDKHKKHSSKRSENVSVGKRKKITNEEKNQIEIVNQILKEENNKSKFNDCNNIPSLMSKLIHKEYTQCNSLFKAFIALFVVIWFSSGNNVFILLFTADYFKRKKQENNLLNEFYIFVFSLPYLLYYLMKIFHINLIKRFSSNKKLWMCCLWFETVLIWVAFFIEKYSFWYLIGIEWVCVMMNIVWRNRSDKCWSQWIPQNWKFMKWNTAWILDLFEALAIIFYSWIYYSIRYICNTMEERIFCECNFGIVSMNWITVWTFAVLMKNIELTAWARIIKKNWYEEINQER